MAGAAGVERPFIGRLEAVDALRRRSDAVRAGRGGLTVIEGDSGVGKSVLIDGLVRDARAKGLQVLLARATSSENAPPYLLLQEALGSAQRLADEDDDRSYRSVAAIAFAPTAAGGGPAFPMPRSGHGPESWLREDHLADPFQASGDEGGRRRLESQWATEFLGRGDRRPTLVVLEDLHFADEGSLEALGLLAPQLGTHALWLIYTRLPLGALTGPRRAALEGIERAGDAEHVPVRPFNPGEAAEFVRGVDRTGAIREEEIIRWHSQSGGNPSFLEQLVRRRGELVARGDPTSAASAPEFTEYLARQLASLPPREERVVALASVLGRQFAFSLLLRASEDEEETLAETIQELVARGVLRELPEEVLEFPREDLRTQVYGRLTEARRRLLHRRVGEALEACAPADVATIYALAGHFYHGRIDDRAAAYNRLAGEFAARSFAPLLAQRHFERALESLARLKPRDPSGELETALALAVQLDRLGELEQAEHLLHEALRVAEGNPEVPADLRAVATVCLVRIHADQGRWEPVDEITSQLLRPDAPQLAPATQLALHRLRGEFLYFYGRYEESLAEHDLALAIARGQHDEREVALETVRRANVLGMIPGRFEEAVADYQRVVRTLVERGDHGEAAHAQIFLGVVLSQNGHNEEGLAALAEAQAFAEKAHDLRRMGWALFNIADLERERGGYARAQAANTRAREVLEKIGDRFGMVQVEIVDGKIALGTHDYPRAERELLEAYRLVRELNVPADEVEVLLRLAELAFAQSDRAGIAARLAELDRLGLPRLRPDLIEDYDRFRAQLAERDERTRG